SSIGESAAELLAALRDDPTVAGVIMRVDSGGGSALTSDHIARQVKKLKDSGKPVVVSMAGYAASGGYYISAYADRIIAEAGTLTGSIGVTGFDINLTGTLELLGVGSGVVSAGPSGEFGNPFLPRREADGQAERGMVMYIYERFVNVVAEGRGMDRARVDELGKGQIWLGSEAVENGLVDALGGLVDAKAAMEELLGAAGRFEVYLPGTLEPGSILSLLGLAKAGGASSSMLASARAFVNELAELGEGALYLAPEYLYRER
ncbi:MAG TPA: S49 family peptidase, partial [Spirochaetales bacterium]|nr:S49 family peptidase [Spirochaetales bacterium]